MNKAKIARSSFVGAVAVGSVLLGSLSAWAFPGTGWGTLIASHNGAHTGEAKGQFQGYREDMGRGSRVENLSYHRQPKLAERGAYVAAQWYHNGNHCYLSSANEAGGSIACQNGWDSTGDTDYSVTTTSSSWQRHWQWWSIDATSGSARAKLWVCEDVALRTDRCSSPVIRGAKYD